MKKFTFIILMILTTGLFSNKIEKGSEQDTTAWKKYENKEYGIKLSYPHKWWKIFEEKKFMKKIKMIKDIIWIKRSGKVAQIRIHMLFLKNNGVFFKRSRQFKDWVYIQRVKREKRDLFQKRISQKEKDLHNVDEGWMKVFAYVDPYRKIIEGRLYFFRKGNKLYAVEMYFDKIKVMAKNRNIKLRKKADPFQKILVNIKNSIKF